MNVGAQTDLRHNQVSFEQRAAELEEQNRRIALEKKVEQSSPFSHFYQGNKSNARFLRSCLRENPKACELLLFLCEHMDQYNAVMCSHMVFQEVLGISRTTAFRCVNYLKDHGFIHVYKSGTSNVYVANDNLVWNSWGNNRKYCEFPANIVLSASEQEGMKVKDKKIKVTEVGRDSITQKDW